MKKLFVAIRHSDIDSVKALIEKKPELIRCTAKQPPKKDDGQSPLQVAIKSGNFEIAHYLLNMGADVNFMESDDCCNEWRAPALHDAIRAAVMESRWNCINYEGKTEVFGTKEKADAAFSLLKRMLEQGADVKRKDSCGNSALVRAILDAAQILPGYNYSTGEISDNRIFTDELREDLTRIFKLLFEHGADCREPDKYSGIPLIEFYEKQPVGELLKLGDKV